MPDAKNHTADITAEQEDRALFKTYGGPIAIELVPRMNRVRADTLLIRGFFDNNTEITAVFSGRRARETGPLEAQLQWLDNQARHAAVAARRPVPAADMIRLQVQIKGCWRHDFRRDDEGNETRSYQLVVARWAFTNPRGELQQFGEPPSFDTRTRKRPKSYILGMREIDAVPQASRHFRSDQETP
ncbi:hypothetical protein KX928_16000 [Roseobacter sp. YSTF-M11]|uniref:Uncharacterized protein n=1 Tax=Roseobacter insulae TaxID=2859783 RepID=A0A9X1FWE8_9RHOB|nr:hypothetical protein [Roseobacter insulae]MBW4709295.1 hypothetical protein [Roseobacter insulae]